MCWSDTGTGATLALMQYHNTPGFATGTLVLRAKGAPPRSCESSLHLYIVKILPGRNFIKFGSGKKQKVADESKGTQEGGVMASKETKKSFLHHAPLRLGREQGDKQR